MNFHEKLAGLVLILAAIAFLFAPFSANAEMKITSIGIMKYIVVEDIEGGHVTYLYHISDKGKVYLKDVKVTYNGKLMPLIKFEEIIAHKRDAELMILLGIRQKNGCPDEPAAGKGGHLSCIQIFGVLKKNRLSWCRILPTFF